jgi:hypothetical protein
MNSDPFLLGDFTRGIFLALLYVFITKEDDTDLRHIIKYALLFFLLNILFILAGINREILVSAFISKSIFILIDERIKTNNM